MLMGLHTPLRYEDDIEFDYHLSHHQWSFTIILSELDSSTEQKNYDVISGLLPQT